MTTLNIYLSTTGGGKRDIMRAFGEGAEKNGVDVTYRTDHYYKRSDYAMIFAYKSHATNSPNHKFREDVLKRHSKHLKKYEKNKWVKYAEGNMFFVDSNVLKSYEKDVRYFRFPFKSIHPHLADYMQDGDTSRNEKVVKDLGIKIKPWREDGEHICLFLNRGIGGFSTFGKPCYEWASQTVKELRKHTKRPILIRSHRHAGMTPELKQDLENLDYVLAHYKDVKHTRLGETSIYDDLKNAWACITYTSTAGAVAMLEGIPMFSMHQANFSHKWTAGLLNEIENPLLVDRDYFISHFVNAHWTLDEVRSGMYWEKFIKKYPTLYKEV